jgi:hypothetical protein
MHEEHHPHAACHLESDTTATPPGTSAGAFDKNQMMPVQVMILTQDHEIRGLIFVSRKTRPDRRITELLNDPKKRFLAVVDAEIIQRHGTPSSPQHYAFMQVHVDKIIMLHPSVQSLYHNVAQTEAQSRKLSNFREKLIRANGS